MATLWQRQDGSYMLLWQRYDNKKMVAMRYYGNVILHLQQYSHRLNLLFFLPQLWPFVYKYRLLETPDYLLIFYLIFNFTHSFATQSVPVLTVNTVGIPTCSQHLLTWFVRRPDDGHVRTETCSITHNKAWCVWQKLFHYSGIDRRCRYSEIH